MARQTRGEFLQTLRKANGYTQQEVADKLGISNKTLSSWETDRAYPDLLSIPALADLYGVTADEILRGERKSATEREEQAEDKKISDKYERVALNNKYLKFNTQSYILLIPSCAAALLIFAAMFLPFYIGLILFIIGLIALITAVVLQILFYRNTFISAGIAEGEELTIWQTKFKMDVNYTLYRCLKIDGIAYLCLGLLMLLIAFIADANHTSYSDFNALYYITAVSAAIAGIAALAFIYRQKRNGEPTPIYTEKQYAIKAKNKKLLTKCIISAVIFCLVIMIAAIILLCNTFTKTDKVYSGWTNEVKTYLQTLIVEQDSELHNSYGVAPAGYYFDLPAAEDAVPYEYFDLEHGFYAYYNPYSEAFVIDYQVDSEFYLNISYATKIMIGDVTAYNVRYCALEVTDNSLASGMAFEEFHYTTPEYSVELTDKNNAIYTIVETSTLYIYDGFIVWVWIGLSAVAIIIPAIIYLAKRKKVK